MKKTKNNTITDNVLSTDNYLAEHFKKSKPVPLSAQWSC